MRSLTFVFILASVGLTLAQGRGGGPPLAIPRAPFGDGPWTVEAAEGVKIRMSVVTKGLANPWSLAWLPDGSMLITERPGRLRLLKNGVLDPTPISGVPVVKAQRLSGLMDVALHPRFAENRLVYLTYNKGRERRHDGHRARARPARGHGPQGREGPLRRRAVVGRRRRLRVAHRVRPRRHALHDHRLGRRRQLRPGPGEEHPQGQDPAPAATTARCRRTIRSSNSPSSSPRSTRGATAIRWRSSSIR